MSATSSNVDSQRADCVYCSLTDRLHGPRIPQTISSQHRYLTDQLCTLLLSQSDAYDNIIIVGTLFSLQCMLLKPKPHE